MPEINDFIMLAGTGRLAPALLLPFLEEVHFMNKKTLLTLTALSSLALTACGKQTFETVSTVSQNQAPGYFDLAPKVDILLAQDNTGSMNEIYDDVGRQMPALLDDLSRSGWDYHFASMPLTASQMDQRLFTQVLASKQDRNWGSSEWIQPYPGATFGDTDPGEVNASYFRRPFEYSDYHQNLVPSNALGGVEPGLETVRRQLKNHMAESKFHRQDAMLVVIVVGNGDDTSGRKICRRWDGYEAPCDAAGMGSATPIRCGTPGAVLADNCTPGALASNPGNLVPGTAAYAKEFYRQQLQALRPSSAQIKLFAAVSGASGTSNCRGHGSLAGAQYMSVASALGGSSHDICANSAGAVLASIKSALNIQKLTLRTIYLMMDAEPDTASIRVVRYIGGDRNQAVDVPQDATNGWTYAGMIHNQPRVVTDGPNPVTMNTATGWAVKLNGTARLQGSDTAEVIFLPSTN